MIKRIVPAIIAFAIIIQTVAYAKELTGDDKILNDESGIVKETVDATVNINEDNIERSADDRMLGLQYETTGNEKSMLTDGTIELSTQYKEMAKNFYRIPVARSGGTSLKNVNPLDHVGSLSSRKGSPRLDTGEVKIGAQSLGVVEWIKSVLYINPDAEFIPCLSLEASTVEDNVHFAQFLLDPADKSEWGALRAKCGLPNPINVAAIEIGNELDNCSEPGKDWWYTDERLNWYVKLAREIIDSIKAVEPDVKFCACGKTAPRPADPNWRKWTIGVCEAIGKDCDYMSYHMYYSGYEMAYALTFLDAIREDVDSVLGPDNKMKFMITEHAKWYRDDGDKTDMLSLEACLATGQFLSRMYRRSDVWGATYHNFYGYDNWWSMWKTYDNKLYMMGLPYMYKAYQENIGDRVVESNVESDSLLTDITSTAQKFSALVMAKDKRELHIILDNREPYTEFNLKFNFKKKYKLVKETVFTAPNIDSYVANEKTKNVFKTIVTEKNENNFTEYKMPTKSMVFLTLEADSDIKDLSSEGDISEDTSEEYTGEKTFTDIDNYWASNEINFMKDAGIISGETNDIFNPNAYVSRAEVAKMICRILKLTPKDYGNIYSDVLNGDWFEPYVETAYNEGIFRFDKNFRPDDSITLEELSVIAARVYKAKIGDITDDKGVLDFFKYKNDISDWAKDSIICCVKAGILNRLYENGYFKPGDNATRGETTAIMYRLFKKLGN